MHLTEALGSLGFCVVTELSQDVTAPASTIWPKIHSHRSHGACTQLACLGHSASTCSPTCHNYPELSWIAATKRKWARLRSSCCYSRMPRVWETPQQEAWCHVVSVSVTPLSYFDVWPWPMVPLCAHGAPMCPWLWSMQWVCFFLFSVGQR